MFEHCQWIGPTSAHCGSYATPSNRATKNQSASLRKMECKVNNSLSSHCIESSHIHAFWMHTNQKKKIWDLSHTCDRRLHNQRFARQNDQIQKHKRPQFCESNNACWLHVCWFKLLLQKFSHVITKDQQLHEQAESCILCHRRQLCKIRHKAQMWLTDMTMQKINLG